MASDAIFALVVPAGRAALHLHRVSGPGCVELLAPALFRPALGSGAGAGSTPGAPGVSPRAAPIPLAAGVHYLHVRDADGLVDDAVVTVFRAPRSFTGEDTVEIGTHGNPLIAARLQRLFRSLRLREARPGEFTQRAFLNGKLDLAQAEAVREIIHAETQGGIELARRVTEGVLSNEMKALRDALVGVLAHLEAHIDFAEDEVGAFDASSHVRSLEALAARLAEVAGTYEAGVRVREGVRVALCGEPNAGKSTLFNALLRSDRAIVTPSPGTTRDVLEERLDIGPRSFVLCDTAGLREADDPVERIGVQRTRATLATCDVACLVIDGARAVAAALTDARALRALRAAVPAFVVLTRADQSPDPARPWVDSRVALEGAGFRVAVAGAGRTREVEEALASLYDDVTGAGAPARSAVLISERQRNAVAKARALLSEAADLLRAGAYPEMVASVLIEANRSLVEVVGEISVDDVLEGLFSSFCIGK